MIIKNPTFKKIETFLKKNNIQYWLSGDTFNLINHENSLVSCEISISKYEIIFSPFYDSYISIGKFSDFGLELYPDRIKEAQEEYYDMCKHLPNINATKTLLDMMNILLVNHETNMEEVYENLNFSHYMGDLYNFSNDIIIIELGKLSFHCEQLDVSKSLEEQLFYFERLEIPLKHILEPKTLVPKIKKYLKQLAEVEKQHSSKMEELNTYYLKKLREINKSRESQFNFVTKSILESL